SIENSLRLAPHLPAAAGRVSESGIESRDDLDRLRAAGYEAFLIGERLMREGGPGAAPRGLLRGRAGGGGRASCARGGGAGAASRGCHLAPGEPAGRGAGGRRVSGGGGPAVRRPRGGVRRRAARLDGAHGAAGRSHLSAAARRRAAGDRGEPGAPLV